VARFLVLYHSSTSAREQMANATPEQAKAGMDAWMSWAGRASILEADSAEAAASVLDGHPHLQQPGNSIELLGFMAMPGMER
jgi:hypothetical protein